MSPATNRRQPVPAGAHHIIVTTPNVNASIALLSSYAAAIPAALMIGGHGSVFHL
jgi:hypothetical protein